MADITAGLPTLRPEEEQARKDRERIQALGKPVLNGALDIGTFLPRALVGAGNLLVRGANALGAELPMQRLPGDSPDALPQFRLAPYSAAASAKPEGSWEPLAMTAPVPGKSGTSTVSFEPAFAPAAALAPVQAAAAPRTPKPAGAKTAASMPAGAPAPLVPAVDTSALYRDIAGVHQEHKADLVPGATYTDGLTYVTEQAMRDPEWRARFEARNERLNTLQSMLPAPTTPVEVYRDGQRTMALPQLGYAEVGQGTYATQTAATGGMDAYIKALAEGQQRSTDPLAIDLEKARIAGQFSLQGHQAGAAATVEAARVNRQGIVEVEKRREEGVMKRFGATPQVGGDESVTDALGMSRNSRTMVLPNLQPGGMPTPISATKPKPNFPDGTQVKLRDGRTATMKNGQPVPN